MHDDPLTRTAGSTTRRLFPCGLTRRELVWEMGGGFAGLALAALLERDGFFPRSAHATGVAGSPARTPAPARACIFLMMNGGPSQVDTFDYKPELLRYAGKSLPEGKQFINSGGRRVGYLTPNWRPFRHGGESGLLVSDYFPRVREHADRLAVIRSCHTDSHAHGSALVAMNTGSTFIGRPSLGSWVTYGLGSDNDSLPSYVVLLDKRGGPISGQPNWSSGFMPATQQGTLFRPIGDPILDLRGPKHVDRVAQRRQLDLLAELNERHLRARPHGDELAARIASYELAYRMQAEAPEAVDLRRESDATKRLYGLESERTAEFGRNCLIARRLVERGVRFVQLYHGGGPGNLTWDAHSDIEENHLRMAGESDKPVAGLLKDLRRRGLLEKTLVVWAGEFGRTPMSQGSTGRDHSPFGFSVWLAGGGAKGGQVIGTTDEVGLRAVEDRHHVNDLHATILNLLGLDHYDLTFLHSGRDERLTDAEGAVIEQIV